MAGPPTDATLRAERFVRDARQALLDGTPIAASGDDILLIARSWPARKRILADIRTSDQQ